MSKAPIVKLKKVIIETPSYVKVKLTSMTNKTYKNNILKTKLLIQQSNSKIFSLKSNQKKYK